MLRKSLAFKGLLVAFATLFAFAQANAQCKPPANQKPPLSPAAEASTTLNGKLLVVYYCAPSLRGRQLGDQLVPNDKVWRTGANTATTFRTQALLRIGKDQMVPAGTYTLYTIPSNRGWTLIINKQTGQWGTVYNSSEDLGRVPMQDGIIASAPVETFKIQFENTNGNRTELHLHWGNMNVFVPVAAID